MRFAGPGAWLAAAVAAAIVQVAFAERQPYERYQSIVERQMFGPLPPGFDPTKSPAEVSKSGSSSEKELTKEQEKVKSAIRFSVINVTPGGETAIGFTDNSDPKVPRHYYLKVGESRDGWEVKEADAKAATMTIAKDGIEVSLSLGGDSSKEGKTQAAQPAAAPAAPASRRSPMLDTIGSRSRARREREEAERRDAAKREEERAAAAKAREEEERARREEEKAQREAEREERRRELEQIREELRKSREERQARDSEPNGGNGPGSDAE